MKILLANKNTESDQMPQEAKLFGWRAEIRSVFLSWEFYLIAVIASFLRLYAIQTTEFDTDQSNVFGMAYNAIHHGLLVATADEASLHNFNPPGPIYLLMVPAAFTANPLWGAIEIAILGILAVLLLYVFTRRYYGRLAGTFAALLYGTAVLPTLDVRFIWNPNFLPIFVVLFFFTLFRGVVERRKGWLFPAIFLIGVMYQLHSSSSLLAAAALTTWLLAPGTVRWRDIIFGVLAIIFLFSPYVVWLISTHFHDIAVILHAAKQPAHIDDRALFLYKTAIMSFVAPFTNTLSYVYQLVPYVDWIRRLVPALAVIGGIVMLGMAVWPRRSARSETEAEAPASNFWRRVLHWWNDLRADPARCSLIVLLVWSVVPLVALTRHAIPLYPQYFISFMPAPFILIALLLAKVVAWLPRSPIWGKAAQVGICLLVVLISTGQAVTVVANIQNTIGGRNLDSTFNPYHNDLQSLQDAIGRADAIAQQRHINRLYISMDVAQEHALHFLSEHTQTPATAFMDSCWLSPAPGSSAIMLVGPYADISPEVKTGLVNATLLEESPRHGKPPFKIYLIESPTLTATTQATYPQNLQLLADRSYVDGTNKAFQVVRWNVLRSAPVSFGTLYTYTLTNQASYASDKGKVRECDVTALQPGEQLLTAFPVPSAPSTQANLKLQVQYSKTAPLILAPRLLPISFLTGETQVEDQTTLQTAEGKESAVIQPTK